MKATPQTASRQLPMRTLPARRGSKLEQPAAAGRVICRTTPTGGNVAMTEPATFAIPAGPAVQLKVEAPAGELDHGR